MKLRQLGLRVVVVVAATSALNFGQSQTVALDNLRFVSDRGVVTSLSPTQAIEGVQRGTLLASVDFQTDIYSEGQYRVATLDALWKFEASEGYTLLVNGVDMASGDHWYGAHNPVRVTITDVNPTTGACSANLAIPVGGNAADLRRMPFLPGSAGLTLTVELGWRGQMALDSSGEPTGALCQAASTFACDWPDVVLSLERPQGHPQIGDGEVEFVLALREPATQQRTIQITAQPSGSVTVLDSTASFDVDEAFKVGHIRGEDFGDFRLIATENGVVIAESAIETVVQRVVLIGWPDETVHYQSESAAEAAAEAFETIANEESLWLKKCTPAEGVTSGAGASYTVCGPCLANGGSGACKGDGSGDPGYISKEGSCSLGLSSCSYTVGSVTVSPYDFVSSDPRICKTVTVGGTAEIGVGAGPGGGLGGSIGGSVSVTTYYYTLCCKYENTGGAPQEVSILDCE